MFECINVPSEKLADCVTAVLWHNEYLVAPKMHQITDFGKDVGVTARTPGNQDIGGILAFFKINQLKDFTVRLKKGRMFFSISSASDSIT